MALPSTPEFSSISTQHVLILLYSIPCPLPQLPALTHFALSHCLTLDSVTLNSSRFPPTSVPFILKSPPLPRPLSVTQGCAFDWIFFYTLFQDNLPHLLLVLRTNRMSPVSLAQFSLDLQFCISNSTRNLHWISYRHFNQNVFAEGWFLDYFKSSITQSSWAPFWNSLYRKAFFSDVVKEEKVATLAHGFSGKGYVQQPM